MVGKSTGTVIASFKDSVRRTVESIRKPRTIRDILRVLPPWMVLSGAFIWLVVCIGISPLLLQRFPDEGGQRTAYFFLVVGTLLMVLSGLIVGIQKVNGRLFLFHAAFGAFLVPPSFFRVLSGFHFTVLVSVLTVVLVVFTLRLLKALDQVLDTKSRSSTGALVLGLVAIEPEFILYIILSPLLFNWAMGFLTVENSVVEVVVDPDRPVQGENFTITVSVDLDENLTGTLEYSMNQGEFVTKDLTFLGNRTYSIEMEGLPYRTRFVYRIQLRDENGSLVGWTEKREIVIL